MRLLVAIMQSRNKCSLLKYDKKRLGCDNPVLFIITQAGQIKYTYLNKVAKLNVTKYTVNQPNTNISMQRESAMFLIFRLKVLTTPDSVVLNSRHIHLFPYFEIRRVVWYGSPWFTWSNHSVPQATSTLAVMPRGHNSQ